MVFDYIYIHTYDSLYVCAATLPYPQDEFQHPCIFFKIWLNIDVDAHTVQLSLNVNTAVHDYKQLLIVVTGNRSSKL